MAWEKGATGKRGLGEITDAWGKKGLLLPPSKRVLEWTDCYFMPYFLRQHALLYLFFNSN